jgi:hypothetical protein
MTQSELTGAQSKARALVAGLYIVPFALWATSIATYCHFEPRILSTFSPTAHWALILGVLFGWVLIFLPVEYVARAIRRQCGLACSACGAILVGRLGMVAVATGRCGRCGGQITSNSAQVAPHEPPPRGSDSDAPNSRTLDSLPESGSSGGR